MQDLLLQSKSFYRASVKMNVLLLFLKLFDYVLVFPLIVECPNPNFFKGGPF